MTTRLLALAVLLCFASTVAAAGPCARPDELRALNARVLQTRLMVAALTCSAVPQYNATVTALRPALNAESAILRAYFQRSYGTAADVRLDGFVTRLANEQSLASTADRAAFCAAGAGLFAALAAAKPAEFEHRLDDRELAAAHRIAACPPPAGARTAAASAKDDGAPSAQ